MPIIIVSLMIIILFRRIITMKTIKEGCKSLRSKTLTFGRSSKQIINNNNKIISYDSKSLLSLSQELNKSNKIQSKSNVERSNGKSIIFKKKGQTEKFIIHFQGKNQLEQTKNSIFMMQLIKNYQFKRFHVKPSILPNDTISNPYQDNHSYRWNQIKTKILMKKTKMQNWLQANNINPKESRRQYLKYRMKELSSQ